MPHHECDGIILGETIQGRLPGLTGPLDGEGDEDEFRLSHNDPHGKRRRGETTGIVAATGTKTYFGRTVELVQVAKPKLRMEEVPSRVVRWLVIIVSSFLTAALVVTALKDSHLLEILPLAVVLVVSAIPVALPTMFTISMALRSLEKQPFFWTILPQLVSIYPISSRPRNLFQTWDLLKSEPFPSSARLALLMHSQRRGINS
jgi:hypothetical protein